MIVVKNEGVGGEEASNGEDCDGGLDANDNDGDGVVDGDEDDGDGDGVGGQVRPSHSRGNCALSRVPLLLCPTQVNLTAMCIVQCAAQSKTMHNSATSHSAM